MVGCALSASMSTASLAGEFSLTMTTLLPPGVSDPVWRPDKTSQPGVQGRQNSTGEGGNPPGEPPRSPLGVPHQPGHQTPGGQRGDGQPAGPGVRPVRDGCPARPGN